MHWCAYFTGMCYARCFLCLTHARKTNSYPGLGLGVIASKACRLSDAMITAGVDALARMSPALKDPDDGLLPDLAESLRDVSVSIAAAVANKAHEEGLSREGVEGNWTEERIRG
jgi:malate dehydrogenase (oxaloacetate-decarboxylating)